MPEAIIGVSISDETLVGLARGGDRSAFEELFRRHRGVAYRVAFRMLGHEQDALDVVQEGLMKAWARLNAFDGRSSFRTWLLRIVTNVTIDSVRKRKQRANPGWESSESSVSYLMEPATEHDPAHELYRQDLRRALDTALSRLSTTTRTTFVLNAEAGLSYKEIAEIQGIPIGTVMSRIFDARQKLQAFLKRERV